MSSIEAAYLYMCEEKQHLSQQAAQQEMHTAGIPQYALNILYMHICHLFRYCKKLWWHSFEIRRRLRVQTQILTHPYDDQHFAAHPPSLFLWRSTHCSKHMKDICIYEKVRILSEVCSLILYMQYRSHCIAWNNFFPNNVFLKPEDSTIVSMDLVNPIESICNPLEETNTETEWSVSQMETILIISWLH